MGFKTQQDLVDFILKKQERRPLYESVSRFAPANIALCKYWGKKDDVFNLPTNSSLSISLGGKGTYTTISCSDHDTLIVNGEETALKAPISQRLFRFLNLFRLPDTKFHIQTTGNLPLGAGLASSASSFASYILALSHLYGWQLSRQELSILARLGSGSAARSIYDGFVVWHAASDPLASYAEPLKKTWDDLCIGLILVSDAAKPFSSSEAMKLTKQTSPLYQNWAQAAKQDFTLLKRAIRQSDFQLFGEVCEHNAMTMHATMIAAKPMILYWLPETLAVFQKVHELRKKGLQVYLTEDAGPNVKLLFLRKDRVEIQKHFPEMDVVQPFSEIPDFSKNNPFVVRIDKRDRMLGFENKQLVHERCLLHRAISVLIYRRRGKDIEILLQKRHKNKYHSGGLWANTCCSHPQPHGDLSVEAQKILIYEMGFSVPLKQIGHFTYQEQVGKGVWESEYDYLFVGQYQEGDTIRYHPEEIFAIKWMPLEQLKSELKHKPDKYVVWLPEIMSMFNKYINH